MLMTTGITISGGHSGQTTAVVASSPPPFELVQ